jgi:hypothetical protein
MAAPNVIDVDEKENVVTLNHPALLGTNPNKRSGMTFTNESNTRTWRGLWLDGRWRDKGPCRFKLMGPPLKKDDLTDANGDGVVSVLIWDMGLGDTIRAPIHARLVRTTDNTFELRADTDVTITLGGKKAKFSPEGKNWTELKASVAQGKITFTVPLDGLVHGRAIVRIEQ